MTNKVITQGAILVYDEDTKEVKYSGEFRGRIVTNKTVLELENMKVVRDRILELNLIRKQKTLI